MNDDKWIIKEVDTCPEGCCESAHVEDDGIAMIKNGIRRGKR